MKIALIIPQWRQPCGIYEYARDLAEALGRAGAEAEIGPGDPQRILHRLTAGPAPEVVHIQYGYYLCPAGFIEAMLALARRRGFKIVATLHGFRADREEHHRWLCQIPVVVHSPRMELNLVRAGFPQAGVHVCPMPCPPLVPGLAVDPWRVGYFGFLLPHKGVRELMLAVESLISEYPGINATILSALAPFDASLGYCEQTGYIAERPALSGRMRWETGFMDRAKVLEALARCRINVLPYSEHTEIGVSAAARVVIAAGRPLITTGASFFDGLEEVTLRIRGSDPTEIALALDAVFQNRDQEERLSRASKEHAIRHSWAEAARWHLQFYRSAARPGSLSFL